MNGMPKYKCHKEVYALKIKEVAYRWGEPPSDPGLAKGATLIFHEAQFVPKKVDQDFVLAHDPQVDDYYLVYPDGTLSISPAKAFEDCHMERINK